MTGQTQEKFKVACLECGATNLFPSDAGGKTVRCGRCKSDLPVPGSVLEPQDHQIAALIQASALPLLIDFYSDTCMPCRMMAPVVASLAGRRRGELTVIKINTEAHRDMAASLRIRAVPTFVVFRKGFEVGRVSGAMNETDFSLWVASKA
jgi:thioredoxin 2